jgi:hypothetical protein
MFAGVSMQYLFFTEEKYAPMICLGITRFVDAPTGKFLRDATQGASICVKDSSVLPL